MALVTYTLKRQLFNKPNERCGGRNAPRDPLVNAGLEPCAPLWASAVRGSPAGVYCGHMADEEDLLIQWQVWAPPSSVEHLDQHERILWADKEDLLLMIFATAITRLIPMTMTPKRTQRTASTVLQLRVLSLM